MTPSRSGFLVAAPSRSLFRNLADMSGYISMFCLTTAYQRGSMKYEKATRAQTLEQRSCRNVELFGVQL